MATLTTALALSMRGVQKVYPPATRALRGVDFELAPGEIRGLVGMNGAGKSTLVKILSGIEQPSDGSIEVGGEPASFARPADADRAGIGVVHQELPLLPNLSAADNVALGLAEGFALTPVRRRVAERRYSEIARSLAGAPPADALLEELGVDAWQMVAIVRALATGARILILDEPTSSLNADESASLHDNLVALAADGVAIIYVSHLLEDVLDVCQRVTVFRDGLVVDTVDAASIQVDGLLGLMTGEAVSTAPVASVARRGTVGDGLVVQDLVVAGAGPLSFEVAPGESVGIYGLRGSGAADVVHAVAGVERSSGVSSWRGRKLAAGVARRTLAGVSFVSGDRAHALLRDWTVARNHGLVDLVRLSSVSRVPARAERVRAQGTIDAFALKGSLDDPISSLSGGNQQKVSIGRALAGDCIVADEPTRGVDTFACQSIRDALRDARTRGASIVVHSTDAEELVAVCDRVLIMAGGRVVDELSGDRLDVESLEAAVTVSSRNQSET